VAYIAKPEGYTGNRDGDCEEGGCHRPAQALCPVEELLARCDVPANLEMHRKSADENYRRVSIVTRNRTQLHLLQTAMDSPPEMRKAPDRAQERLEYMSLGVISL
jgi:hypothetical protein